MSESNFFQKITIPMAGITLFLVGVIGVLAFLLITVSESVHCEDTTKIEELRYEFDSGFQTSSRYLNKVAKWRACADKENSRNQDIYRIVKDLSIKADSYAWVNKITFLASIVFIIMIFLFPILALVLDDQSTFRKVILTQIPAITLLAGLSFDMNREYKHKQSVAENLMRYTLFSSAQVSPHDLAAVIRKDLLEIDTGYDFSRHFQSEAKPADNNE